MDLDDLVAGWPHPPSAVDIEDQASELEALESIFGDDIFVDKRELAEFSIRINIDLPHELHLQVDEVVGPAESAASACRYGACPSSSVPSSALLWDEALLEQKDASEAASFISKPMTVCHLPPLRLDVRFRAGYPSSRPPLFTLTSEWIPAGALQELCLGLDDLWQEGAPVVFTWVDWLQSTAIAKLNLDTQHTLILVHQACNSHGDRRAQSWLDDPRQSLVELLSYDVARKREVWNNGAHTCILCFDEKAGTSFVEFGTCGHMFCANCIREMLRVHVQSGRVSDIACPQLQCRTAVSPAVVERLLSDEVYRKWRRLHMKAIVQELSSVVWCPSCEKRGQETPVVPEDGDGSAGSALATCSTCTYSFCPLCRESFHPTQDCAVDVGGTENIKKVLEATPLTDTHKRKQLLQELESLKFLKNQTVPCPRCRQSIHRISGCNKMKCTLCLTCFCYRCGKDITGEGYSHFKSTSCPTFDREEVERINARQLAAGDVDEELEQLRRQFPGQEQMFAEFDWAPRRIWEELRATRPDRTRQKQDGDKQCPGCRQWNSRAGKLNLKKCHACNVNFCFACGELLRGKAMEHFTGAAAQCPQHAASALNASAQMALAALPGRQARDPPQALVAPHAAAKWGRRGKRDNSWEQDWAKAFDLAEDFEHRAWK